MAIFNRYKYILDNFINSSDLESPNLLGPIDKKLCNILKSEGN